ncbi:MAG: hypothetical protein K2M91_02820 [Lachnospiraceae bacterium]|nr:hypothetical protein [Lachnospiraceae bacterium]
MKLDYFKDKIFELINDADNMYIKNIETNDREDKLTVQLQDGTVFEVNCRQLKPPAKRNIKVCWLRNF